MTTELFSLSGKTAVVTGGASGLGLAIAEAMAEAGADVALIDVDRVALDNARARISGFGHQVSTVVCDVGEGGKIEGALSQIVERHGHVDIVFVNAGISGGPGPSRPEGQIEATDMERWDRVVAINLTGAFMSLRAAAAIMKKQKSGRIIVTSSYTGLKAEKLVSYSYAATKAAVANLVRQAAQELAPYNVLVNGIAPGPFRTNIANGKFMSDPSVAVEFASAVPLGRVAEPDEIKGLAVFLASAASSYVTGAIIPIDGGASAV